MHSGHLYLIFCYLPGQIRQAFKQSLFPQDWPKSAIRLFIFQSPYITHSPLILHLIGQKKIKKKENLKTVFFPHIHYRPS